MINFGDVTKENTKQHNPNWPQIPDHPYRMLIIGSYGSRKVDLLLNLINHQAGIDKIYLYAKDPYEEKYHILTNKRENIGFKAFCRRKSQNNFRNIRINSAHFFVMNIPSKQEFQQIAISHSSGNDFQDFRNYYNKSTKNPYLIFVIDTILASDNLLHFIKNILEII